MGKKRFKLTPPVRDGEFVYGTVRISRSQMAQLRILYKADNEDASIRRYFDENYRQFGSIEITRDCLGPRVVFHPAKDPGS